MQINRREAVTITSIQERFFNHANRRALVCRFLYLLAGVLAMAVCSNPCRAQSFSPEAIVDNFVTAWNTHAALGFERLFTADAVWVPVAEVRDEGRENIVKDLMSAHTSWARETTIAPFGSSTIRKPTPDVAIIFFRMKFLDQQHQPIAGLERAMVIVAVKNSDGWRISAGQLTKESVPR